MLFINLIISIILMSSNCWGYKIEIIKKTNKWILMDETSTPFIVKGVCYSPVPIGQTVWDYELFSDMDKPWHIDAGFMEKMGVNTVRIYSPGQNNQTAQKFIRQMYKLYSIYTIFPVSIEIERSNFASKNFKNDIKKQILDLIDEYKDTPGILVWLIGNEIDYFFYDDRASWETEEIEKINSSFRRAKARAEIVFEFVNNIAIEIKKIDDKHPVGISLGKTDFFNLIKEKLPDIDFVGLNCYMGSSFSSVWNTAKKNKKPILITEFGYDAYNTKTKSEDQKNQSKFIQSLWRDIENHSYLKSDKSICLGGCLFEWIDEWWKYLPGSPKKHDTIGSWPNAGWLDFSSKNPNNVQEEWFGILKMENTTNGIYKKTPRLIYHKMRDIWNSCYD